MVKCLGRLAAKRLWQEVKKRAGWTQSLSPRFLKVDGLSVSKPQDMATRLNNYFIEKIVTIKRQLGPPVQDPLLTLKAAMGRWQGCGRIEF